MRIDELHIAWKIILYALAVLTVIVSILGAGYWVLGGIAASFLESGYNDDGPVHYFGLNPPYPPQWSAEGTSILLSPWGTMLVETGANGTEVEYVVDVYNPNISPDGTRMAFATLRHGDNYDIGVSNLDGSNYRRLTKTKSSEANPVWSPDGSNIVFIFNRFADDDFDDEGPAGLYIMDADGSDMRMLAPRVYGIGLQAWSPDGRTLAFLVSDVPPSGRYQDIRYYIHTVGRNGSNLTRLAESISLPAWSPDGTTIAFLADHRSIAAINPDGSGLQEIAYLNPNSIPETRTAPIPHLSWSPDGSEILLQDDPFILAKADGSGYGVFNVRGEEQAHASWSPDGSRIAVDMQKSKSHLDVSNATLSTMAKDGSDKRVLVRTYSNGSVYGVPNEPWAMEWKWVWYSSEGQSNASTDTSVLVGPPNSLPLP